MLPKFLAFVVGFVKGTSPPAIRHRWVRPAATRRDVRDAGRRVTSTRGGTAA